jgi:amino acid transporter
MPKQPKPVDVSATLARNRLGVFGVIPFNLASIGPLLVTAGVVPAAYAVTGLTGVPAAFALVAAVLALFVPGYLAMARRISNAGAFYAFISRGLGRPAGVGGALVAVVAYNLLQVGLYGMIGPQLASYAKDNAGWNAPWWAWAFAAWAVVAVLGLLPVDLSSKVLGVLSAVEILVIAAIAVRGLSHPAGGRISVSSLSPASLHPAELGAVIAIAVLGFIGFEQAPVLGEEARDPARTLPRATYLCLAAVSLIYIGASLALNVYYGPQVVPIAQSPDGAGMLFAMAPGLLASLARTLFLTSLLAAALAFHTAVGRYMWALGQERVLPAAIGATAANGVPRAASMIQSALGAGAILVTAAMGWDPVDKLFFWGGTTGGFGILLLLAATSMAVVRYFRRTPDGQPLWSRLIAPGISAVLLTGMAVLCVVHYDVLLNVPAGSAATSVLPGMFALAAVIGIAWALLMKKRQPAAYQSIGMRRAPAPAQGPAVPAALTVPAALATLDTSEPGGDQ